MMMVTVVHGDSIIMKIMFLSVLKPNLVVVQMVILSEETKEVLIVMISKKKKQS